MSPLHLYYDIDTNLSAMASKNNFHLFSDNTVGYEIMCVIELGFGQIAGSAPTLGKMFHLYDKPSTTNATPARFNVGRTSRTISQRLSSRLRRDTDSNLTLVPRARAESVSRKPPATYDEEANTHGIVQQISFSILKAEKGKEGEGNFWKIEAEQH